MNTKTKFSKMIISLFIAASFLMPTVSSRAASLNTIDKVTGCAFGYTLQDLSSQWVEIQSSGDKLAFSQADDAIIQLPEFGFAFPFFENTYQKAYASTNGFISFGPQNENAYPNNYSMPSEFSPNNIIAGFWDDLTVGGNYNAGAVYFQVIGVAPNRKAVLEWDRVTRLGATDRLSFEIVLFENGNIAFNYQTLNGVLDQATVGIEDSDGVDGCQLVNDAPGLGSNQSVQLTFPGKGARVKAKPLYQGQFLVNGMVDLPFTLVNTGTQTDSFHFQVAVFDGSTNWQVMILDDQGIEITNTPAISPNQSYLVNIRVMSADPAPMGSYTKGELTIISNANSTKNFAVRFDTAVPAPFTTFYVDSSAGYVKFITPDRQITKSIFPSFSGSSFAVSQISGLKYFMSWEYIRWGVNNDYENIQKAIIKPTTGMFAPVTNLVDNDQAAVATFDANPMMAVLPDGTIGLVFLHSVSNEFYDLKTNIYFARLDSYGKLLSPIISVTQNEAYQSDYIYNQPVIAATSDHRFVIAYEILTPIDNDSVAKDIDLAVVSSDGDVLTPPYPITDSQTSGAEYYAPTLTPMNDGNVFAAYLSHQSGIPLSDLNYTVVHSGGVAEPSVSLEASGEAPQVGTLLDGTILLAWIREDSRSIGYTMFDQQGNKINDRPLELASVNGWKVENISLTGEVNGNGVITWKDEWGYHLYYALVGPGGEQITPPMAFLRGSNTDAPNIISSSTGRGIAPLEMKLFWFSFLPAIYKK